MTVTADAPAAAPASESTAPAPVPRAWPRSSARVTTRSSAGSGSSPPWSTSPWSARPPCWCRPSGSTASEFDVVGARLDRAGRHVPLHRGWPSCSCCRSRSPSPRSIVPLQVGASTLAFPRAAAAAALGVPHRRRRSDRLPTPSTAARAAPTPTVCGSSWRPSSSCWWRCRGVDLHRHHRDGPAGARDGPRRAPLVRLVHPGRRRRVDPHAAGAGRRRILSYLDVRYGGPLRRWQRGRLRPHRLGVRHPRGLCLRHPRPWAHRLGRPGVPRPATSSTGSPWA